MGEEIIKKGIETNETSVLKSIIYFDPKIPGCFEKKSNSKEENDDDDDDETDDDKYTKYAIRIINICASVDNAFADFIEDDANQDTEKIYFTGNENVMDNDLNQMQTPRIYIRNAQDRKKMDEAARANYELIPFIDILWPRGNANDHNFYMINLNTKSDAAIFRKLKINLSNQSLKALSKCDSLYSLDTVKFVDELKNLEDLQKIHEDNWNLFVGSMEGHWYQIKYDGIPIDDIPIQCTPAMNIQLKMDPIINSQSCIHFLTMLIGKKEIISYHGMNINVIQTITQNCTNQFTDKACQQNGYAIKVSGTRAMVSRNIAVTQTKQQLAKFGHIFFNLLVTFPILLYQFLFKMLQIMPEKWQKQFDKFKFGSYKKKSANFPGSTMKKFTNLYGIQIPNKWIAEVIAYGLYGDWMQGWQCQRSIRKVIWYDSISDAITYAISPLMSFLYLHALQDDGINAMAAQFGKKPVVVIDWYENPNLNTYFSVKVKKLLGLQLSCKGSLNRMSNVAWPFKLQGKKNNRNAFPGHWEDVARELGDIYSNYNAKFENGSWYFWPLIAQNKQNILLKHKKYHPLPVLKADRADIELSARIFKLKDIFEKKII